MTTRWDLKLIRRLLLADVRSMDPEQRKYLETWMTSEPSLDVMKVVEQVNAEDLRLNPPPPLNPDPDADPLGRFGQG